jgi:hypothetical protein
MFRLLVKLAVVALLANAVYRVGSEYLVYVKFRDGIRDAAMFKARNNAELHARIMDLAAGYEVPLAEDAVTIRREARRVFIDGHYRKTIEIAPNVRYPWDFSWSIDALVPPTVRLLPES